MGNAYFSDRLLLIRGYVRTLIQDHSDKVKVTDSKIEKKMCPVYNVLMDKHWKILLHTKIDYDLSMCHNLDSR